MQTCLTVSASSMAVGKPIRNGQRTTSSLMAMSAAALVLALLLLAGCASVPHAAAPARLGLRLSPATLGQQLSLQQHLTVEREGRTDELDTALEIDDRQLTLVGLAVGQRVMTLEYDGVQLKTWRHFMLPAQVRGEDVLEDLQLTLWPAAAIAAALPPGWTLQDNVAGTISATPPPTPQATRRTLSYDGKRVTVIDYPGPQRWSGAVVLTNLRYHYRLTITTAGP